MSPEQREMAAYDALPAELRRIFDECPMKVSVYNTMRMPGIMAAQQRLSAKDFKRTLEGHLAKLSARAYEKDLTGV